MCAIVVVTGLCIGLGLVIFLKKKKPCQRDEENWDSASAIWEDEHSSLNGKTTIPISSITMGKLLGTHTKIPLIKNPKLKGLYA